MVTSPVRVCFVCTGNICRSPTAEVVLRARALTAGLDHLVVVDSAGTGAWHVGQDMDPRARQILVDGGFTPPVHEAKVFDAEDFERRDVVVALDSGHRDLLWRLAGETDHPAAARAKIVLLRTFDPLLAPSAEPDVADPYYGGVKGFTDVLAQIERSCSPLLAQLTRPDASA